MDNNQQDKSSQNQDQPNIQYQFYLQQQQMQQQQPQVLQPQKTMYNFNDERAKQFLDNPIIQQQFRQSSQNNFQPLPQQPNIQNPNAQYFTNFRALQSQKNDHQITQNLPQIQQAQQPFNQERNQTSVPQQNWEQPRDKPNQATAAQHFNFGLQRGPVADIKSQPQFNYNPQMHQTQAPQMNSNLHQVPQFNQMHQNHYQRMYQAPTNQPQFQKTHQFEHQSSLPQQFETQIMNDYKMQQQNLYFSEQYQQNHDPKLQNQQFFEQLQAQSQPPPNPAVMYNKNELQSMQQIDPIIVQGLRNQKPPQQQFVGAAQNLPQQIIPQFQGQNQMLPMPQKLPQTGILYKTSENQENPQTQQQQMQQQQFFQKQVTQDQTQNNNDKNDSSVLMTFHNISKLAEFCGTKGDYKSAITYYQKMTTLDPENGPSWTALGHCYLLSDQIHQAFNAYQHALYCLEDIKDPQLWYGIGILYEKFESYDHAISALIAVLKMSPNFYQKADVLYKLGVILTKTNQIDQAIRYFQNSILSSNYTSKRKVDTLIKIGCLYEQQGDFNQAQRSYEAALSYNDKNFRIYQHLAWCNFQNSQINQALQYIVKAENRNKGAADSLYIKGRCLLVLEKYQEAYECLQQAAQKQPTDAIFWTGLAISLYQQGNYTESFEQIIKATSQKPELFEVWYNLGILYEQCKQPEEALIAYNKVFEIQPGQIDTQRRIAYLKGEQLENHQKTGFQTNLNQKTTLTMKHPFYSLPSSLIALKKYQRPENYEQNLAAQNQPSQQIGQEQFQQMMDNINKNSETETQFKEPQCQNAKEQDQQAFIQSQYKRQPLEQGGSNGIYLQQPQFQQQTNFTPFQDINQMKMTLNQYKNPEQNQDERQDPNCQFQQHQPVFLIQKTQQGSLQKSDEAVSEAKENPNTIKFQLIKKDNNQQIQDMQQFSQKQQVDPQILAKAIHEELNARLVDDQDKESDLSESSSDLNISDDCDEYFSENSQK